METISLQDELRERLETAKAGFESDKVIEPWAIVDIGATGPCPTASKITHATLLDSKQEDVITQKDERLLLLDLLDRLQPYRTIIGFNLWGFDLPLIKNRATANRINIRLGFKNIVDLREVLAGGNRFCRGRLRDYVQLLGVKVKESEWCKRHHKLLEIDHDIPSLSSFLLMDCKLTYTLLQYLGGSKHKASNDQ